MKAAKDQEDYLPGKGGQKAGRTHLRVDLFALATLEPVLRGTRPCDIPDRTVMGSLVHRSGWPAL